MIHLWKLFLKVITFFAIIVSTYWNSNNFIADGRLGHNMMESLLVGSAIFNHQGLPYKDLWGIYPPGIYIFMGFLDFIFNGNVFLFKFTHIVMCITSLLIFWKIMQNLFPRSTQLTCLIVLLAAIAFNSYAVNSVLFSSVLICTFFSILALHLLLFNKNYIVKYGVSAFLFSFCATLKDPFTFLICLVPLTLLFQWITQKDFRSHITKVLFVNFAGTVIVALIILGYISVLNIYNTYLEVFAFKFTSFGVNNITKYHPTNITSLFLKDFNLSFFFGNILLLMIITTFIFLCNFRKNFADVFSNPKYVIIIFFVGLNFLGFLVQNRYGFTYSLQMILPIFFLIGLLILLITFELKKTKPIFYIAGTVICLLLILPSQETLLGYTSIPLRSISEYTQGLTHPTDKYTITESEVNKILANDNRVLNIYGWGTPQFFYQTKTKPYNRYFITNPQIMGPSQIRDWVLSFNTQLPKVVVYNDQYADMNVDQFESQTINMKLLLNDCYTQVGKFYILPSGNCSKFNDQTKNYVNEKYLANFNH